MKIQILSEAEEDLVRGYRFYEIISPGLGRYFLDSLIADIDSLIAYAGIHEKVFGHYRLLSRNFPFAVYYDKQGEIITVLAILDCRQNPDTTKDRMQP